LCLILSGFFANAQQEETLLLQSHLLKQHAIEINLRTEQVAQIDALDLKLQEAYHHLYSNTENGEVGYSEPEYKAIQEQHTAITNQHSNRLKAIISEKQFAQLETVIEAQKLEFEIQNRENQKQYYTSGIWEDINLSTEQIEAILDATDALNRGDGDLYIEHEEDPQQMTIDEIYDDILTEEQYSLYLADIEAKKREQIDKTIAKMDEVLPPLEALVLYFEEESFPKHQALRARLEAKISAPDRVYIESIRTQIQRMFENTIIREMREDQSLYKQDPEIQSRLDRLTASLSQILDMQMVPIFLMMVGEKFSEEMPYSGEELKKLVETYSADIEPLREEIAVLKKADYAKEQAFIFSIIHSEKEAKQMIDRINLIDMTGTPMGPGPNQKDLQLIKDLSFLLIPVKEKQLDNNNSLTGKESFRVYPSPSKGQHTLELNLIAEDKIKVELLDHSGKTIQIAHLGGSRSTCAPKPWRRSRDF